MRSFFRFVLVVLMSSLVSGPIVASAEEHVAPQPDSRTYTKTYPIRAVATVGMIADIVQNIAGPHATVETIIGHGGDPHLYKASPNDVRRLVSADIIFYNGLFLEGKMAEILESYNRSKPSIALGDWLDHSTLFKPLEFEGHYDPHIWMDVQLWSKVTAAASAALQRFDPTHAADYKANEERYQLKLKQLDSYVRSTIASIPREQRVLVTAHDAFRYFSRAYDIEVKGIQGISTESEAGLKDINSLVDFLVARKISAVFVESSVSQKNIMALIEGAASRNHKLVVGGELFSDAMGAEGTPNGTYLGMISHNAETIAHGLGGTVPAGGFAAVIGAAQ